MSRFSPLRTLRSATLAVALGGFLATAAAAQGEPELLSPGNAAPHAMAKSTASVDRMVTRQRPVELNMAPLLEKASRGGTSFNVELFDGQRVTIDTTRVEQRSADNVTYFGKVRGQARSEAVLTYVGGHLSAEIMLEPDRGSATQYRIRSQGTAGHWLQEVNGAAFPPDHPSDVESLPAPRLDKLTQGKSTAADLQAAADSGSTVDLMVVYSTQTAAAAPGIASEIQSAVDRANLAYANTGIAFRLRLVHSGPANYSESGSFSTDLSRLSGSADGYMDDVHALRTTKGADMVSLFIEGSSACGIGYIGPSTTSAFTVVNRGCAGGNLSLAHEIGHNFGARHDVYVDSTTSPYAYGHGFTYAAGGWRTVMAYNDACAAVGTNCTRLAYISNPANTYGGVAMGSTATANNAKVHNDNAYTVANFRQAAAGGCTYAFSPASASVAAAGATGSTAVTAGSGCAWNTSSSATWLTVGAGSGTSGSGTLNYAAAANTGPARTATLSVGGTSFTVSQSNGCTYTVSPTSASATSAGGSASVSVTTSAGCTWNASSGAAWMSITAGASGSGSGTVNYSVQANAGALRTGNLTVAGRTVTVTQAEATACTYSFSPTSANVGVAGGSGSTTVTAPAGCAWNANSSASWLTVGGGSATSGSGTLNWIASANSGPARSATISVGGSTFTVSQPSGCTYAMSPTSASVAAGGGSGSTAITATSGCAWNATSSATWLSVGAGSATSGSGTLNWAATANPGPARSATITVGGTTFTVTQANGCTYAVSPTSYSATATGGMASASVTAAAGCAWTATSNAAWLTVTAGASGSGSGTLSYSIAGNTGTSRSGTLSVAGGTVTVTQSAASPAPSASVALTPTAMDFGSVTVGTTSLVASAVYSNTGAIAVTIASITQGGANPADFVARNACAAGQVLQPGESCSLGYAFSPKATGTRSAAATIVSDAGSKTISLAGSGRKGNNRK